MSLKAAMIGILAMISSSAFADPVQSEFERGYEAGKLTCSSGVWACTVVCTVRSGNYDKNVETVHSTHHSRAQALIALTDKADSLISNDCVPLILAGKAECKQL